MAKKGIFVNMLAIISFPFFPVKMGAIFLIEFILMISIAGNKKLRETKDQTA
ncbi:hypothetical protein SAMN05877753_11079 [Bacillus oleivorans]|uniref:Uncharacterized protein n=1 Tax=Bacillus oleivorans TaxID=1448271 RepID=A0A285D4S7_9BACI|nr:hypothetical protein [Bacillus oleivorans]SNX74800.1 hypothetical protein SAMN05877753_11079 [Bacillus oleivorans]